MNTNEQPFSVVNSFKLEDELGRISALDRYQIMDTEYEHEFANICGLIKSIFRVRYVAINFIDSHRQWSKAIIGSETLSCQRQDSICNHTIRGNSALNIENASLDARFAQLPSIAAQPHVRSYLGVPLTSPDGYNIGSLCVYDTEPRLFSEADIEILRNFAKVVMTQMEMRLIGKNDTLTGAKTYRSFMDDLDRICARNDDTPACLLTLDFDHLSAINSAWGYRTGDTVLRQVSEVIRASVRRSDAFGRIGGEEFAVLLDHCDAQGALTFSERLRSSIASHQISEINGQAVTLSIGITQNRRGEARSAWLTRANSALYAAKHAGRDRCHIA